ncbi:MAG: glycosyltransferase family 1 protein [Caldilinea sp. CFX5]|nr:glycosyltransferase family 1 protein [Caldilinea sp. CFX5]
MKILYLIDTLEIGGAEKSILEIASHFCTVTPIVCHLYPGDRLKAAYEQAGIHTISLNLPGKYSFSQAILAIQAILNREQVDMLHTTLFRADMVGRVAGHRLDIPVISSFVNEAYTPLRLEKSSLLSRVKLRGIQIMDALTARWCTHFTANSETIKTANAKALCLPASKITVIYRGRDPKQYGQAPSDRIEQLRKEFDLHPSRPVLLNVARLLQRKGQRELVQAMAEIRKIYSTALLLIVGEGGYRPDLEQLIHELDVAHNVKLIGQRDDISELLHLSDVFIFPSHYEGYPGALVEAMFAGCPIVASDIPVHREAIEPGKTGILTTVKEPLELAQSVITMLRNREDASRMGQNAQQVALGRFKIEGVAAQHEQLYTEVLQKRKSIN